MIFSDNDHDGGIALYDEVVDRFGASTDPALMGQVTKARDEREGARRALHEAAERLDTATCARRERAGTIDERFVGAVGAGYGTLHLIEDFTNKTGMINVTTKSVEGSGMIKGFAESLKFSGVWTLFTGGGGTFSS